MRRLFTLAGVCALVCALSSCGATAPSSITGTWNGTWTDPAAGPAALALTVTQTGTSVVGTWTVLFPNATFAVAGTLTGTLNGTALALTLAPTNPAACERSLAATVDQNTMKGTYAYANCASTNVGSFTLTEQ
jgi:hypothetical protein